MREVGLEEHVVLADDIDQLFGRRFSNQKQPQKWSLKYSEGFFCSGISSLRGRLFPFVVERLEDEGDPADAALDRYDLEIRAAVEDAAVDHV